MPKHYFEDFIPGAVDVWGARAVTRDEITAFAKEFDPQPHHLDDAAAEASILNGLSASGWHSCAIAMRMASDWFLLDTALSGTPGVGEVRWKKPVRPGDLLSLRRTVLELRALDADVGSGMVPMVWELVHPNGEIVMSLQITIQVARRPQ